MKPYRTAKDARLPVFFAGHIIYKVHFLAERLILILFSLKASKRELGKQCRPRSDDMLDKRSYK